MAASRLIAEIEVKGGELAIKQVRGFNAAVDESGKAGSRTSRGGLNEHEKKVGKLSKATEGWLGISAKAVAGVAAIDVAVKGVKAAASYEQQVTRLHTQAGVSSVKQMRSARKVSSSPNRRRRSEHGRRIVLPRCLSWLPRQAGARSSKRRAEDVHHLRRRRGGNHQLADGCDEVGDQGLAEPRLGDGRPKQHCWSRRYDVQRIELLAGVRPSGRSEDGRRFAHAAGWRARRSS